MAFYEEQPKVGNGFRETFLIQVETWLDRQFRAAEARRNGFFRPDLGSPEAYAASVEPYRGLFVRMLGWPLTLSLEEPPPARQVAVGEDELGAILRLWMEVLPGVELYGLLFVPPGEGPHPLVISQHGGLGTPELCSGFFGSANYNDMTRRVLRRGAVVFAPQLFRWDAKYGRRGDVTEMDRQLKQLGGSIAALELYFLRCALDGLTRRREVDPDRIGMIGLSYGGFHTLFASAADTRIRVALSSCFFNDRRLYGRRDWGWFNAANTFFDAEVASLVCPRALYLEVGARDEKFDVRYARAEADKVRARYAHLGLEDRFRLKVHAGGHELDEAEDGIDFLCEHLGLSSR
jgi:dienelactone hydrolase